MYTLHDAAEDLLTVANNLLVMLLAYLLVSFAFAVAAPVPKGPPPVQPKLTKETLVATWRYEWAQMCDGIITFNANGEYVGIHDLTGSVVHHG